MGINGVNVNTSLTEQKEQPETKTAKYYKIQRM